MVIKIKYSKGRVHSSLSVGMLPPFSFIIASIGMLSFFFFSFGKEMFDWWLYQIKKF
jgi:hypothetical protein